MHKNLVNRIYRVPLTPIWVLSIACIFFLAACGNITTPTIETTPTSMPGVLATTDAEIKPTANLNTPMLPSTPHVSPYIDVTVERVEILYLKTNPVQVQLIVHGTLPDQCKYDFYSIEHRSGSNVKISLSGIHPADNSCSQTVQTIEYTLLLGRDFPESKRGFVPGDYELVVNNYKTSFSIK